MGVRVNQNVMAMNAHRGLSSSEASLSRSLERLSSGFRINRAADDAAGLVVSESLRSQVIGLKMAARNAQDGVSVVQTAEGALTESHAILQRMRELSVQAASTGSADAPSRDAAQAEVEQLKAELDRIANTTMFGQQQLLTGASKRNEVAGLVSTSSTIDTSVNKTFAFWPDVEPGLINAQPVTLTSNRVYDANVGGATDAAALESDINQALHTALAPFYPDPTRFRADVSVLGAPPTASFQTTFSVDQNHPWHFALEPDAPVPTVNDLGGLLGIGAIDISNIHGTSFSFQVGAGTSAADSIPVDLVDVRVNALNLASVDVSNAALATSNIAALDAAISTVSTFRGNLGAYQNRFEHTISNLSVTTENLSTSESRIRDTDMAAEMQVFTRSQVLQQAGTAMLAQANSVPQAVLQLLK